MALPRNTTIQVATCAAEIPPTVARQIGNMWLRRYNNPNPAVEAIRGFKAGRNQGVLVWVLDDTGKVLGWALKALEEGKRRHFVMLFVRKENRRQGLGDAMLDTCRTWLPTEIPWYYPHSQEATSFFDHRTAKLTKLA